MEENPGFYVANVHPVIDRRYLNIARMSHSHSRRKAMIMSTERTAVCVALRLMVTDNSGWYPKWRMMELEEYGLLFKDQNMHILLKWTEKYGFVEMRR